MFQNVFMQNVHDKNNNNPSYVTFKQDDQGQGNFSCYFRNESTITSDSIWSLKYTQQSNGDFLITNFSVADQKFFGSDIPLFCSVGFISGCAIQCLCEQWSKTFGCIEVAPLPSDSYPIYLTQNSDNTYSFYVVGPNSNLYLLFDSDSYTKNPLFASALSTDNTDKNKLLIFQQ
jgi:hypothetical protein